MNQYVHAAIVVLVTTAAFVIGSALIAQQKPAPPAPSFPCYVQVRIADTAKSIHDADTLTKVDLLLPWNITIRDQSVRLLGFDAHEVSRVRQTVNISDAELVKGRDARDALIRLCAGAKAVYLLARWRTATDPYGRLNGHLYVVDASGATVDVAQWAVKNGHVR